MNSGIGKNITGILIAVFLLGFGIGNSHSSPPYETKKYNLSGDKEHSENGRIEKGVKLEVADRPASPERGFEHPNVLLILVDDLNDWVGCLGGHPNAFTPNIDKLAGKGMLFSNAHCAAPICNPSRTALLSGLAPHRTGVYDNGEPWSDSKALKSIVSMPLHFKENGYYTMTVGKVFHSRPDNYEDVYNEKGSRFGGHMFGLHSDEYNYPFTGIKGIYNWATHWGPLDSVEAQKLSDPKIAQWAANKLAKEYDRPFFLSVGFHRPHTPLAAPREFYDRFQHEQVQLPVIIENDLDDIPALGRQIATAGHQEMQNGTYKQIDDRNLQGDLVESYLAACSFVDAQVGKVIRALENSPNNQNTIIVLASDHGWSLGEKLHYKKWALWETTTHVPMIIFFPGMHTNGKTDAGVTLLDIYPTLVDLCDIPVPGHSLDGKSLRPLLENPDGKWERPALTTFGRNNHALRTPRWRYIRYTDDTEELYDHYSDPEEWHNVADIPGNKELIASIASWLPRVNEPSVYSDPDFPIKLTSEKTQYRAVAITDKLINAPIHIIARIGPEIGDGVIVCQGNQFAGYSLYIQNRFLCFAIMDIPSPLKWDHLYPTRTIIHSYNPLPDQKMEIVARLSSAGEVTLTANGLVIGSGNAETLSIQPAGPIIMGSAPDNYIPVGDYSPPFPFQGAIEEVFIDIK